MNEIETGEGRSDGLFVDGEFLFEVRAGQLHVFSVRDATMPELVHVYETDDLRGRIGFHDSKLYSVGSVRAVVFDVSDPFDVREVSRFEYPYNGPEIQAEFSGEQVLIADQKTVRMIDFSDTSNPHELFAQPASVFYNVAIGLVGDFVLYGRNHNVSVYELVDQHGLSYIGESELLFHNEEALFVNELLYLNGYDQGSDTHVIHVYDMSDPLAPLRVSTVSTTGIELEYLQDAGLVTARSSGAVEVFDVSDVKNPFYLGLIVDERRYGVSAYTDG